MNYKSSRFRAIQRAFDLRMYLKECDSDPKEHGGEWSIDCPQCAPQGKSKKLWVLVDDKMTPKGPKRAGHWICYYCDESGTDVLSLIKWIEDCNLFRAIEVLMTYQVEGKRVSDLRKLVQDTLFGVQEIEATWDEAELPEMDLPVGFRAVAVGSTIPPYFAERGIKRKRALRYGLGYVPKASHSKHRNRLVVPVTMSGRTVLWVARYMQPKPPAGVKKTLYPFGGRPNRVLFNFDRAKTCERVYLVEDVFSAMHIGRCAMATLGTQFSQYQMELLLRCAADEVVIVWDRDLKAKQGQSGYEKALKLGQRLAEFWRVRVVKLPDDRDPDELTRAELDELVEGTTVLDDATAWQATVRQRLDRS